MDKIQRLIISFTLVFSFLIAFKTLSLPEKTTLIENNLLLYVDRKHLQQEFPSSDYVVPDQLTLVKKNVYFSSAGENYFISSVNKKSQQNSISFSPPIKIVFQNHPLLILFRKI